MANKDDEQVLVIKSDTLFAGDRWQGLKTENLDRYIDLIKNNCEFKRRGDVENDKSYKQIIPYILFSFKNSFFAYKYLSQAGEKRLVDTYQLGVGGHINPGDNDKPKNILETGMMREWNEEVDFKGNITEKKLIGIINDDSQPVESVHLGLVYNFIGDKPEISIKEKEKMEGELVGPKNIWSYIKGNPSIWTKIVYKEYLSKL